MMCMQQPLMVSNAFSLDVIFVDVVFFLCSKKKKQIKGISVFFSFDCDNYSLQFVCCRFVLRSHTDTQRKVFSRENIQAERDNNWLVNVSHVQISNKDAHSIVLRV